MKQTGTGAISLTGHCFWVGAYDPQLRIFDELYPTESGTTYNAYLIRGEQKTVLVDSAEERCFDEFFSRLSACCSVDEINVIVTNHTEHDHSGSIGRLLEMNPGIEVWGSPTAMRFLREQLNRDFNAHAVKDGERLDLGGRTLRFILAPFLHWPDTLFTWVEEEGLLISGDAFGAHFCPPAGRIFDDEVGAFYSDFKLYFDTIVRPFKSFVQKALKKVEGLPVRMICPSHGPVRRTAVAESLAAYKGWSQQQCLEKREIVLLEHSPHGTTRAMGDRVVRQLEAAGYAVQRFAAVTLEEEAFQSALECADGLIVGAATINRDAGPPVWRALTHLSTVTPKNRLAIVYGAYGWSGEAVALIEQRLLGQRYVLAAPGVRWQFTPTAQDVADCQAQVAALLGALAQDATSPA
ncbi:MAG: FprA family A-type flavoprotein [Desulfuromonadaceae bacterium]|nr:FprA family A-type flavoprotein [Desulfuromonadaceae bacterium]